MTRALAWVGVVLFCAAWWSVWFSLHTFGVLMALSMACVIAAELLWHVRYRRAYLRHPSNVTPIGEGV